MGKWNGQGYTDLNKHLTGKDPNCTFDETGIYCLELWVQDDNGIWCNKYNTDYCYVVVMSMKVNLDRGEYMAQSISRGMSPILH